MIDIIDDILSCYGLTRDGSIRGPAQGTNGGNLIVGTKQKGDIFVRTYELHSGKEDGFYSDAYMFEPEILAEFSRIGNIRTPEPLRLASSEEIHLIRDNLFIFLYELLPGQSLTQDQLSLKFARQAGQMLLRMIEYSVTCSHWQHIPGGGTEYIGRILDTVLRKLTELRHLPAVGEFSDFIRNYEFEDELSKTPKGIVHGDYFYENVLCCSGELTGIVDFGDLFYGEVLHDIANGSMEFGFLTDGSMDFGFYAGFLDNFREWMRRHHISFDLFLSLHKMNCIRLFVHSINIGLEKGMTFDEMISPEFNPYIERYNFFCNPRNTEKLRELFPGG